MEAFFDSDIVASNLIPLWIKISYTFMVVIIVPIYWKKYGPANFLWLSDIALFTMLFALWLENSFLSSMMALGVLPLEIFWTLDFCSGAKLGGIAKYMFKSKHPLYLRLLSLFHIPLMLVIIYMLIKFGYNPNVLPFQIALLWILFPLTYLLVSPSFENVNWVFGLGEKPKKLRHPIRYLILLLLSITFFIYLPWHFILKYTL